MQLRINLCTLSLSNASDQFSHPFQFENSFINALILHRIRCQVISNMKQ